MIGQRLHIRVDMMAHLKPEIKSIHIFAHGSEKVKRLFFSSSLRSHIHFGKCMCESAMVINFKMDEIHYTEWLSFIQTVFSSKYSLQLPTQNNLWNMVHFQKEYFS